MKSWPFFTLCNLLTSHFVTDRYIKVGGGGIKKKTGLKRPKQVSEEDRYRQTFLELTEEPAIGVGPSSSKYSRLEGMGRRREVLR